MKRLQYQSQVIVPPSKGSNSWLETVTVDRTTPQTTPPQSNWQKAVAYSVAAIAPFIFFTNIANVSIPTQVPVFSNQDVVISYPKKFQYQSLAFVAPQTPTIAEFSQQSIGIQYEQATQYQQWAFVPISEVITVDKWHPPIEKPPPDINRLQYLYPYLSWDTAIKDILIYGQQSTPITYPRTTQYQALTQAPFIQEVITIDKWYSPTEQPLFDLKYQQYTYQNSFWDTSKKSITVFSGNSNPIVFRRKFQYQSLAFVPEVITPDKWTGNRPDIIFDLKREQYTYPNLFWDTSVKGLTVFSSAGNPIVFRKKVLYQSLAFVKPVETVTLDKWLGSRPDIIFDLKRQQYLYPPLTIDSKLLTQPERVSYDKFQPQYPSIIWDLKRQQYTYPSLLAELTIVPSFTSLDRWIGYQPDQFLNLKHQEYAYPFFTNDGFSVEIPSEWDSSLFNYLQANPIWDLPRLQWTYPYFFIDANQLTLPQAVFADAWKGEKPDYIFDLKRQQYTYPHFTIDTKQLTQGEFIVPTKWLGWKPDIIWDIKRLQWTYPYFMPIDPVQLTKAENISLEKWYRETEQPIIYKDVKRWQFLYPSFMPIDALVMLQKGGYKSTPKLVLVDGRLALLIIDAVTGLKYYTLIT